MGVIFAMVTARMLRAAADEPTVYVGRSLLASRTPIILTSFQCVVHCLEQLIVGERLQQTRGRPQGEKTRTRRRIPLPGDEDDRDLLAATCQFLLETWSAHSWQPDVENQAARLAAAVEIEKRLRRRERLNDKPYLLQ